MKRNNLQKKTILLNIVRREIEKTNRKELNKALIFADIKYLSTIKGCNKTKIFNFITFLSKYEYQLMDYFAEEDKNVFIQTNNYEEFILLEEKYNKQKMEHSYMSRADIISNHSKQMVLEDEEPISLIFNVMQQPLFPMLLLKDNLKIINNKEELMDHFDIPANKINSVKTTISRKFKTNKIIKYNKIKIARYTEEVKNVFVREKFSKDIKNWWGQ